MDDRHRATSRSGMNPLLQKTTPTSKSDNSDNNVTIELAPTSRVGANLGSRRPQTIAYRVRGGLNNVVLYFA